MTLRVMELLVRRGWSMETAHLKGEMNTLADTLSRGTAISTEWTLDRESFQWACKRIDTQPEVDLCATSANHQLPAFVAPCQMAGAVGIDCLAVDWNQWKAVYIFPPLPLISRVLAKLESFEGEAVLVIPDWPLRPWYAKLRGLCPKFTQFVEPILTQRAGGRLFSAPRCWTENLVAWTFSGWHMDNK